MVKRNKNKIKEYKSIVTANIYVKRIKVSTDEVNLIALSKLTLKFLGTLQTLKIVA